MKELFFKHRRHAIRPVFRLACAVKEIAVTADQYGVLGVRLVSNSQRFCAEGEDATLPLHLLDSPHEGFPQGEDGILLVAVAAKVHVLQPGVEVPGCRQKPPV